MRRTALAALCFLLAACVSSYRNQSVAITSMAVFDPERYAGRWYEIASTPA